MSLVILNNNLLKIDSKNLLNWAAICCIRIHPVSSTNDVQKLSKKERINEQPNAHIRMPLINNLTLLICVLNFFFLFTSLIHIRVILHLWIISIHHLCRLYFKLNLLSLYSRGRKCVCVQYLFMA